MKKTDTQHPSHKSLKLLSCLVLPPESRRNRFSALNGDLKQELLNLSRYEFDDMVELASSNHVIVRGLEAFLDIVSEEDDPIRADWARRALQSERDRIAKATEILHEICSALDQRGCRVVVIKSLDHWPDLGSDLDLFTNADAEEVIRSMETVFAARIAPRSWGDRLARKWNFLIPGLPEAVEIHIGRLGQTGEQVTIAQSLMERARWILIGGQSFRTASVSDRLMISTLQRMYRHFYFRLCDIVDTMALAAAGNIDYEHLRAAASIAGIWEGVATYLAIVSDYARCYRGNGIDLPRFVFESARFGGEQVYYAKSFLRVPIMPQSARLYGSQLAGIIGRGELHCGARLSLLPWLATAAVVGQKLTGSDKGIW
jgi:Uncharacterised nucleotidyltransferase